MPIEHVGAIEEPFTGPPEFTPTCSCGWSAGPQRTRKLADAALAMHYEDPACLSCKAAPAVSGLFCAGCAAKLDAANAADGKR